MAPFRSVLAKQSVTVQESVQAVIQDEHCDALWRREGFTERGRMVQRGGSSAHPRKEVLGLNFHKNPEWQCYFRGQTAILSFAAHLTKCRRFLWALTKVSFPRLVIKVGFLQVYRLYCSITLLDIRTLLHRDLSSGANNCTNIRHF
jgi:hypothetical protein